MCKKGTSNTKPSWYKTQISTKGVTSKIIQEVLNPKEVSQYYCVALHLFFRGDLRGNDTAWGPDCSFGPMGCRGGALDLPLNAIGWVLARCPELVDTSVFEVPACCSWTCNWNVKSECMTKWKHVECIQLIKYSSIGASAGTCSTSWISNSGTCSGCFSSCLQIKIQLS